MKKQLLSIFAAVAVSTVFAQVPSPSWSISQNANFPVPSAGIKIIDAVDANVVWAIGYDGVNTVRNYNWFSRSINGGNSWNQGNIFPDTTNFVLANMEGLDANTAWVCAFQHGAPYSFGNQGGGGVFRTTNGGNSWVNMTPTGMLTNTAQCFADFVSFFTPSVGIMVGDPVNGAYEIWRTTTGGTTWSQIPSASIPAPLSTTEFAITNLYGKQGTSNLWFGTNEGRVYRTTDAGLSWNAYTVAPQTTTITQVAFSTPLKGVVFGFDGAGTVEFNTTNGGVTWTQIMTIDPNMGQNDIKPIPGTNYYVSVDNVNQLISYSTDNGVTWTNWGSTGIPYLTVDFANPTSGWAGSFSDAATATLGGVWKYSGTNTITSTNVAPTAGFTISTNVCGPTATITPANVSTGSGALSYTWSSTPAAVFSSTSAAAPTIGFAANNTYTITLVTSNTVGTNSSSQVVSILACSAPGANVALPSATCNAAVFTATNTGAAGSPAAGYLWTATPSVGVTFMPSQSVQNPTVKATNPGTYTLTVVASNISGSVSATQTISITDCRPVPTFTLPVSACRGDTIFALNQSQNVAGASNSTYTWTWAPTTGIAQTNTNTPFPQSKRFIFTGTNTATVVYTVTLKSTNSSGTATTTQTISVSACTSTVTGIAEHSALSEALNVYPNPAHDVLNVALPASNDTYTIKLVNVLGSIVHEEKVTKNSKDAVINLANKAKGIYFLNVESSNNEKVTRKVIID